jgi:hypothetical protein
MKQQINEIKRLQQLAGVITKSQLNEDIIDDIDDDLIYGDFKDKQDQIGYLEFVIEHCQKLIRQIEAQIEAGETFDS